MAVFTDIANAMGTETPESAIALFRSLLTKLGLSRSATESEKSPSLLDTLSASVNPIRLANNPIPITTIQAREIYARILEKSLPDRAK